MEDKRTKKTKRSEEKGPSKAELFQAVADAMNGKPELLKEFPFKFSLFELEPGIKQLLEVLPGNEVRLVNPERVYEAINHYTSRTLYYLEAYRWTAAMCRECFDFWYQYTPSVPKPKDVRWYDEEGLCFSRLPWTREADVDDDTSLFDEMMQRTSNADALKAWIGSLFDYESSCQQYVWIYGEGGNGKSALLRFLAKVLGRAYASKMPPPLGDSHWTTGLIGKRLIGFPDCANASFPSSGLFKSITGGDTIDINPKFKTAFTVTLNCKFIFLSNELPRLSSEKADMRRAIFCKMDPIDPSVTVEDMLTYEAKLWAQGGAFLKECLNVYEMNPGNRILIHSESEELENWVSSCEDRFDSFLEQNFVIKDEAYCFPCELELALKDTRWSYNEQRDFRQHLARKYGVLKVKKYFPDEKLSRRVYCGIQAKPFVDRYRPQV